MIMIKQFGYEHLIPGYNIEEHDNPADFFLDIINADSSAIRLQRKNNNGSSKKGNSDSAALAERLAASYRSSSWFPKVLEEIDLHSSNWNKKHENQNGDRAYLRTEYAVSCIFQFYYVLKRMFLDLVRSPVKIVMKILLKIFLGVFVGFLYYDMTSSYPFGVEDRRGLLTFLAMNCVFMSALTLEPFILERPLIIHECASGYYRVSAYFLAKIFLEIFSLHVTTEVINSTMTYYMIGLRSGGFGIFYLLMLVLSLCSSSMAWFVGTCVSSVLSGQFIVCTVCLLMTLTSGAFMNLEHIHTVFKMMQHISFPDHGMRTLYINEFKDLTLYMYNGSQVSGIFSNAGNEFLLSQGISPSSDWELWKGFVALAVMCVIFGSAAYVQLLRIKKLK